MLKYIKIMDGFYVLVTQWSTVLLLRNNNRENQNYTYSIFASFIIVKCNIVKIVFI